MSFAIEMHRGWRNLRVSETRAEFHNSDDAEFAQRFRLLKPRQQRILRYRSEGMSNKEVAARLGRRVGTIKNELTAIYCALGSDCGQGSMERVCYLLGRLDAQS